MISAGRTYADLHVNSVANGVKRKVCDRMQGLVCVDTVRTVSFGGLDAEAESDSNFLRGLAFGNEFRSFSFTRSQEPADDSEGFVFAVRTQVPVEHHLRHFRRKESPAILESFHSGDKISSRIGFQQKAACSTASTSRTTCSES